MGGLKDKKPVTERSMKKRVPGKGTVTCKGPEAETERKAKPEMTQEQKALLIRKGYRPEQYVILFDFQKTMIIRNIVTKEPSVIEKD